MFAVLSSEIFDVVLKALPWMVILSLAALSVRFVSRKEFETFSQQNKSELKAIATGLTGVEKAIIQMTEQQRSIERHEVDLSKYKHKLHELELALARNGVTVED